jgi:hypothetical protein
MYPRFLLNFKIEIHDLCPSRHYSQRSTTLATHLEGRHTTVLQTDAERTRKSCIMDCAVSHLNQELEVEGVRMGICSRLCRRLPIKSGQSMPAAGVSVISLDCVKHHANGRKSAHMGNTGSEGHSHRKIRRKYANE